MNKHPASGIDADILRQYMPPEILQRTGLMRSWSMRMVLAMMGRQPAALADYATRIARFDDNQVWAASPHAASRPGTRFAFAVDQVLNQISMSISVAERTGTTSATTEGSLTNAAMIGGARQLITELVAIEHQQEALDAADRLPAAARFGTLPLDSHRAQLGELYLVTAIAAWICERPEIMPVRHKARRVLLSDIRRAEATAWGVPEAERIDVTEQAALALLDALLANDSTLNAVLGIPAGQSSIPRDRSQRTLMHAGVVEAAKAHLIEYPVRSRDSDVALLNVIAEVLDLERAAGPGAGMTPTEQRRAAKLAAREQRRGGTGKRGRR
ncbi:MULTISPECIES: hypothetical protein [unclassified Crossiella]|uniref:hypothetical protein n=1 Tax=unclassified Crossiella TaxID=2620835 RepID=UPI001FFE5A34|nr:MULTISPECIES: hypothetical protein [unclassified Crossiella]MCK2245499.1 hypothetical protein [Crossiella sp. S99.2]MCK2259156.1 hypothetical protein [Crossiella sp. S99.1]